MKKISFFIALFISLFTQGVQADEYTTAIESMIRQGVLAVSNDNSQMEQLKNFAPSIVEYINGQYITDCAEIFAPYYRKNATAEEMKQMKAYLTKPEIKALMKKITNSETLAKQKQDLAPSLMKIAQGGIADDIKPLECDKEYSEALEKLIKVMDIDKMVKGNSDAMAKMMANNILQMTKSMAGKYYDVQSIPQDSINKVLSSLEGPMNNTYSYIGRNMPTIMRNTYIKTMSLDDIKTLLKIEDQPFYPAMRKVNDVVYTNLPELMQKISDLIMPKIMEMLNNFDPSKITLPKE